MLINKKLSNCLLYLRFCKNLSAMIKNKTMDRQTCKSTKKTETIIRYGYFFQLNEFYEAEMIRTKSPKTSN